MDYVREGALRWFVAVDVYWGWEMLLTSSESAAKCCYADWR
jgi:hypothetical protein